MAQLRAETQLEIIAGATHLFEEPGALEQVARLAQRWFEHHLTPRPSKRLTMRYLALATDYDGTLAHHGHVDEPTLAALGTLRESGRKLILVTGRELRELLSVFPRIDLFDRVVAENGALLYRPETREEKPMAESPPEAL